MKLRRRHFWTIAVGIAAVLLVVLLSLIALGVLVLPGGSGPAPVTVTAVDFTLQQGTLSRPCGNASEPGWFGASTFMYTGVAGNPFVVVAPGGSFSVPLELENYDNNPHTLYSVQADAPFTVTSTSPTLPANLYACQDDALLEIYFTAPTTAGATLTLFVMVNALGPS